MGKFADELAPKFRDSDEPRIEDFKQGTIAWHLQHYIQDSTIGASQLCQYRVIQRAPLGAILWAKVEVEDYRAFARARAANKIETRMFRNGAGNRLKAISPSTIGKDFASMRVALIHAIDEYELDERAEKTFDKAKRKLVKAGLIEKSQPRDRRPTDEEIERLVAYFAKQNEHDRTEVDMVLITRWQLASGRRVGETCKLLWEDWNREAQTILVRKMKDPRRKNKAKVVAIPQAAQEILIELDEKRDQSQARIFPYSARTCSARYTLAKKALGIKDLRLHDNRRETASRLAEKGLTSNQIRLVTGHETNAILDRTYNRPDPATFKNVESRT